MFVVAIKIPFLFSVTDYAREACANGFIGWRAENLD
jgi:hypothetical protein